MLTGAESTQNIRLLSRQPMNKRTNRRKARRYQRRNSTTPTSSSVQGAQEVDTKDVDDQSESNGQKSDEVELTTLPNQYGPELPDE